jgi:hypothetical protein
MRDKSAIIEVMDVPGNGDRGHRSWPRDLMGWPRNGSGGIRAGQ